MAARQALAGARRRQAASEGSLPPMGLGAPAPSGAGGASREEESTSERDRVEGGSGSLVYMGLSIGEDPEM